METLWNQTEKQIENPSLVALRDMRLKYMHEANDQDPPSNSNWRADYAGIANYWKFFDSETKQFIKFKTYEKSRLMKIISSQWAKGKPEYENIFSDYQKTQAWTPYKKHRMYLRKVSSALLCCICLILQSLESALEKQAQLQPILKKQPMRRIMPKNFPLVGRQTQ